MSNTALKVFVFMTRFFLEAGFLIVSIKYLQIVKVRDFQMKLIL